LRTRLFIQRIECSLKIQAEYDHVSTNYVHGHHFPDNGG
jgi:hypothetical protein